jgi:hypothetical protein
MAALDAGRALRRSSRSCARQIDSGVRAPTSEALVTASADIHGRREEDSSSLADLRDDLDLGGAGVMCSRPERRILFQSPPRTGAFGCEGAIVGAAGEGRAREDGSARLGPVFAGLASGSSTLHDQSRQDQNVGKEVGWAAGLDGWSTEADDAGLERRSRRGQRVDGDDDSLSLMSPTRDGGDQLVLASCTPTSPVLRHQITEPFATPAPLLRHTRR